MTPISEVLKTSRRVRGWSQMQACVELELAAARRGQRLPDRASLTRMFKRWESGQVTPRAHYRHLLEAIYDTDLSTTETKGPSAGSFPQVGDLLPATTPSIDLVNYFGTCLSQHVAADALLGPRALIQIVTPQAEQIVALASTARGPHAAGLRALAAVYMEFTGWLYEDSGDTTTAWQATNKALELATEVGDSVRVAYTLMRRLHIAITGGDTARALPLAEALQSHLPHTPARVRALAQLQIARAHSATGTTGETLARHHVDQAWRAVQAPTGDGDELAAYCDSSYVRMVAAACWMDLGHAEQAIPVLERSNLAPEQRRDAGHSASRLALAYAHTGNHHRAALQGQRALELVRTAPSASSLTLLRRVSEAVRPSHNDHDDIHSFTVKMKELNAKPHTDQR